MEFGLLIIFYYGILHAFGPDHLMAIADFSIGQNRRKTLIYTVGFAVAHGLTLFLFAKILQQMDIPEEILAYGDVIASAVIIASECIYCFWSRPNAFSCISISTKASLTPISGLVVLIRTRCRNKVSNRKRVWPRQSHLAL